MPGRVRLERRAIRVHCRHDRTRHRWSLGGAGRTQHPGSDGVSEGRRQPRQTSEWPAQLSIRRSDGGTDVPRSRSATRGRSSERRHGSSERVFRKPAAVSGFQSHRKPQRPAARCGSRRRRPRRSADAAESGSALRHGVRSHSIRRFCKAALPRVGSRNRSMRAARFDS